MTRAEAILYTLIVYKLVLVAIGLWASRRTRDTDDFFLGGRRLGGWVAAISASASSSSAWTLVAVSGMAYLWGWPALWLFPATLSGFLVNWLWVGPRLMKASRAAGAITLTEVLAGSNAERGWPRRVARGRRNRQIGSGEVAPPRDSTMASGTHTSVRKAPDIYCAHGQEPRSDRL
jgi:hypothetical protein